MIRLSTRVVKGPGIYCTGSHMTNHDVGEQAVSNAHDLAALTISRGKSPP